MKCTSKSIYNGQKKPRKNAKKCSKKVKNYAHMNLQGLEDNMDSSLEMSSPVKTRAQRRNNSQNLDSQVEMMTGMIVDNAGLTAFENGR